MSVITSARGTRPHCMEQVCVYLDSMLNSQSGLKVLLCDDALISLISIAYSQQELLKHQVVLVDYLSSTARVEMKHFSCVMICRPTQKSLIDVCTELSSANFSSYSIFLTTMVNPKVLESLAMADTQHLVQEVREVFMDTIPLTEWVCVTQLPEMLEQSIALSAPLFNPLTSSQWTAGHIARFTESITSFILSTNRRPVIRYRGGSGVVEKVAESLGNRMNAVHRSFPDLKATDSVLLLLDRLDDPVTPLLMPWTYEAMIHELIGFQRGNEVLVGAGNSDSDSPDDNRHVLTPVTDTFYKEHRYDDWGQVCMAVSDMVKAYKEMNQFDRGTVSFEEIKSFMTQFPEAKKKSTLVTRHCTIASEMLTEINGRSLTRLSMLEQDVVSNNNVAEHSRQVLDIVQDPKIDIDDALRLAMIYSLHYEKTPGNAIDDLKAQLRNRNCPREKLDLMDNLLKIAGEDHRLHNLFKQSTGHRFKSVARAVGQFGKEVQNVLTEHTPLLRKIVNRAYNGTLETERYPVMQVAGCPIPTAQAPFVRGKDIIVVMVGGATYSEAMLLSQINNKEVDNNQESLMSFGKAVTRKFGGGAAESPGVPESAEAPTAKIEARVTLLSTGILSSKEFMRSIPKSS